MVRFTAVLAPVSHGGYFVPVPEEVVARAELRYGQRVRGTASGVAYQSSLTRYSGIYHLMIPKAVVAELEVGLGDRVRVEIEPDPDPPGERVPPALQDAIDGSRRARTAWDRLSPAHKREHVKYVTEAKKEETRARRIVRTVETLEAPVKPRPA